MKQSIVLSRYDLSHLRKAVKYYPGTIINALGNDNRPVQPIGSRTVYSYDGVDETLITAPVLVAEPSAKTSTTSRGKELTRDYSAFSILILVPVIIFFFLWWYGVLENCRNSCRNTPVDKGYSSNPDPTRESYAEPNIGVGAQTTDI